MDHGRPPPGFCAGTLIATPEGPLPIEDFVPGDAVSLADGSTGTVWWIGMRDYLAAAFRDGAVAAVAPMCLKRDAWGVGRPARDLFVSPTLALDLDGVPILAADIALACAATPRIRYVQLELGAPGLLLADGIAAESYRETGDRNLYGNVATHVAPPRVLADDDPDFHVLADGVRIDASPLIPGEIRFDVPGCPRSLVLGSRVFLPTTASPERTASPELTDRRRLGVCVLGMTIRTPRGGLDIDAGDPSLREGFHAAEAGFRWTDGAGVLPPALYEANPSGFTLVVRLAVTNLPYGARGAVPEPPRMRPGPSVPRRLSSSARVLVIDATSPTPDRDAGSNVILWHMRLLRFLGLAVTFLPSNMRITPDTAESLAQYGIAAAGLPAYETIEAYLRHNGGGFDAIYLHRFAVAEACLPALRRYAAQAPILFNPADLHHLRLQREEAIIDPGQPMAEAVRARELAVIAAADVTLMCNTVECALIREALPEAPTQMLPWVIEPQPNTPPPFAPRAGIMFLGGFGHAPNIDAVRWFVAKVLPPLRGMQPDATVHIYGADMPPEIAALGSDAVVVTGYVPDLGPVFDRHRIMVAPLRYGAGFKGKIAEALVHGVPIVATSIAAEGSGLVPGEHLLTADTAFGLAAALARLDQDEAEWTRLSAAGRAFAHEHLSPERGLAHLRSALRKVGLIARVG